MSCKHCCANAGVNNSRNELLINNDLVYRRIKEMIKLGFKEFYISGGEPLLVNNIFSILKFLKKKGCKVSIATNGFFLNKELLEKLSKIKINLLHVSLDGHQPEIHNSLRGGNFFDTVVENLKNLNKYKIPVRVGCIIWRNNENFLEEMVKFCINLDIKELRFNWLIKVGRFKNNISLSPFKKLSMILNEIRKLQLKYNKKIKITLHRESFLDRDVKEICPGGSKLFFLDAKGKLSPCSWVAKLNSSFITKDSLINEKVKNLLSSKEMVRFKKLLQKRERGNFKGCPFIAKYVKSSYYSNDEIINNKD